MFELMGLIGLLFLFGLVCLAVWILLLPFYLLFRLLGFAIQVGLAGIFVVFAGLLLLPLFLVVGAIVFPTLLLLGIPLLIAIALFTLLAGLFRAPAQAPIPTEAVPPASWSGTAGAR